MRWLDATVGAVEQTHAQRLFKVGQGFDSAGWLRPTSCAAFRMLPEWAMAASSRSSRSDPPDDGIDRLHAHLVETVQLYPMDKNDTQQIPTMLPSRLSSNKDSTRDSNEEALRYWPWFSAPCCNRRLRQEMPSAQVKQGAIPHEPLLRRVLPNTANQEVMVFEAEYAPGGINPRHFHPAAITFHILSGTGIFQEDGRCPSRCAPGRARSFRPEPSIRTGTRVPRRICALWSSSWPRRTRDAPFRIH